MSRWRLRGFLRGATWHISTPLDTIGRRRLNKFVCHMEGKAWQTENGHEPPSSQQKRVHVSNPHYSPIKNIHVAKRSKILFLPTFQEQTTPANEISKF